METIIPDWLVMQVGMLTIEKESIRQQLLAALKIIEDSQPPEDKPAEYPVEQPADCA